MEAKKEEYSVAISILKSLLADPNNFTEMDAETARGLLTGRLETLESELAVLQQQIDSLAAPAGLTGDIDTHFHSADRDLTLSSGQLPLGNNTDEVLNHINNNGSSNPHNITYLILGADLGGMTFTGAGQATDATDIPNFLQVQNVVNDAVVAALAGIDMSGYEPAFTKNTAFNKNFGNNVGDVAEGNHEHVPAQVGLANVLNVEQLPASEKDAPGGVAPIDSNRKIPLENIPDVLLGQVNYVTNWNASTDTPSLPAASTVKGDYYIVNTAGTYQSVAYEVGDWIISDGTEWSRVKNTDAVRTVFGLTGDITAQPEHYAAFYETKFVKNTAFNKDFGQDAGTVSEGNHNHDGAYEPVITKNTAFNKNFGVNAGEIAEGNHAHVGYALSSDVGDITSNPINVVSPAVFAVNSDDVEIAHVAPSDVTTPSKYKLALNIKNGAEFNFDFATDTIILRPANSVQFSSQHQATPSLTTLQPVSGELGSYELASSPLSLAAYNQPGGLGTPTITVDDFSPGGVNLSVAGNISSYSSVRVVMTYQDAGTMFISLLDNTETPFVDNVQMASDFMGGFTYYYSNGDDSMDISVYNTYTLITGNTYNATYPVNAPVVVDRYFIQVKVDGTDYYIGNDGSVSDGSDKSLAILPGTTLGVLPEQLDKNIIELLGTTSFDEAYYNNNKTIYGVFNDIKNKLNTKATIADLNSAVPNSGTINMIPEFANTVFASLGATNTLGTMRGDYDIGSNKNCYKFTSTETSIQQYSIISFVEVPYNFNAWSTINMNYKTVGSGIVTVKIFDCNNIEILTLPMSSSGDWVVNSLSVSDINTLNLADWSGKLFRVVTTVEAKSGDECYVGEFELNYIK
jgi:hypothetical protein